MTLLAPTLQAFFTDRLAAQRQASSRTVAAYRDTFRLLLRFAAQHTSTEPSRLDLADLDAPMIGAFLDHLEHERHNTVRTRNARLAAIHSLFGYAALTPSTPGRSNASCPYPTNASTGHWSATSPNRKPKRYCTARTGPPGSADVTTPCC